MWCHLCSQDYPDFEDFRIHIMEKHRNVSDLNKENSESEESEHENIEISELDNVSENTALSMSQDSDHDIILVDDDAPLNITQEDCCDSDHSILLEDNLDDINASVMTSSQVKCYNSGESKTAEKKPCDSASALNTLSEEFCDPDHSNVEKNEDFGMVASNNLPEKSCVEDDNENQASTISKFLRKRKKRCNKESKSGVKTTVLKKKGNKTSILKKRVQKRKKKVVFSKTVLFKRRKPSISRKKATPDHLDDNETSDHSENSFNGDNVDSQFVLNNFANPQPVQTVNNCISSQTIPNNNQLVFVNPYAGQNVNNYVLGNQAVQSPFYVINTVAPNSASYKAEGNFDFNSKNIHKWLIRHKEICKGFEYPLPSSTFNLVKAVHKGIFDRYCTASVGEETPAVLKVYEELDCMIHKHINSVNNALNIF